MAKWLGPLVVITAALLAGRASAAAPAPHTIELRLPCFTDHREKFYLGLLRAALKARGQPARLTCVFDLPGRRMWKMMGEDKLDLIWGMQTPDKDSALVPIEVDLTDGLAGQRVLLIRPRDQARFDAVSSIEGLRALQLVAGFGEGWFDAGVWQANRLQAYEFAGQFDLTLSMVAAGNRGIDYLPRGVHEIVAEAQAHPALAIERRLLFSYPRDMRFYLTPRAGQHRAVIEAALKAAQASGLKRRIIAHHFGTAIRSLGLEQRRHILLQAPPVR